MKLTIATAALVVSLTGLASAASVSLAANLDLNFTTDAALASGALGSSYSARIGSYSGPALTITTTFDDIIGGWTQAGSFSFASGAMAGYDGYFQTPSLIFTDAAGLGGKNVWLWVTNGSNENLLMFAVDTGVGANNSHLFKFDVDIPNSGDLSVKQSNADSWQLVLGTFTSAGANATYGGSYVLNNAIPEPSAALLGAFGAIGLLRRRR